MNKKSFQKEKNTCASEKFPSELRYDLISKDWVIIASGRSIYQQPFLSRKKAKPKTGAKSKCPFCRLETQKRPTLILRKGKKVFPGKIPADWTVAVVPNKYPAVIPCPKFNIRKEGSFYQKMNAVGFHEVVITRDHKKTFAQLKIEEIKEVIDAFQIRYQQLMEKSFVNHISIFQNKGVSAGASVGHPHFQLITTPLVDIDLNRALYGSERYYKKTKNCIYCQMSEWERRVKKRIVFENKEFLAICPFASKVAFEVIITPKKHLSFFEEIEEKEKKQLAEVFKAVLTKIDKGLGEPDYNFYLHTAPCDKKDYSFYHWHWTILPKVATWAGFEVGTKMEISTVEPEKAAEYLKKQ